MSFFSCKKVFNFKKMNTFDLILTPFLLIYLVQTH